jgi:putative ABC transport system permease protein
MIRNIILVSLRNLLQNRSYTLLHILGLTLGITCTLFIALYVIDEKGFDNFHAKGDRIHHIITKISENGSDSHYQSTQIPIADELKSKYTSVEDAIRFIPVRRELFEVPERNLKFYEEKIFFADPPVFEVFTFPLITGNPKTVMGSRGNAVITEETALRYYGTVDAVGKTFISAGETYTVTGIAENVPKNSSVTFDALLSIKSFPLEQGTWDSWYPDTFVLIAEGKTPADVDKDLAKIAAEHVTPNYEPRGVAVSYWLQALTDIHLKSGYANEGGDAVEYVYIFISIAVFVIILACINYINLATARASRRAKEIGIRKSIGSTKANIMMQFMAESMMLTTISLAFSIGLVFTLLPYFNQLAGKLIDFNFLIQRQVIIAVVGLIAFIGFAGGAYPAFYLSSFNPALVLKGNISRSAANAQLRKTLVSVQFAISIAMIICTSVVYDQLSFMRNKDLGFNRDQVIHLVLADAETMASEDVLYQKLKSHSQIKDVASSNSVPGKGINYNVMIVEKEEGPMSQGVYNYGVDYDFVQTMGLKIAQGRNFSVEFAGDSAGALVNEEMVRSMKWKDPIGKRFYEDDGNPDTKDKFYTVVGVVKDFHQASLHSPITPLVLFRNDNNYFLNVKVSPEDIRGTIGFVESTWREVTNGKPFAYTFLDDTFQQQYAADEKRGQIFTVFSIACLVISCVGLFGLAAYTTEQRAKEIGIRKVVGASVPTIIKLFYSDFMKLIAVGVVIAFPASYFLMNNWMSSFAYKAGLNWVDFILSAAITVVVTMGSISFYAVRAASVNPAETLKAQ